MGKRFAVITCLLFIPLAVSQNSRSDQQRSWQMNFSVQHDELRPTGRNTYFMLQPGYKLTLAKGKEQLVITVLNETKTVDNVETRVVEERETNNGVLIEVSRNYFAISSRTNDVYYFGEDVDIYEAGKVASHEGSWLAGVDGARFGMMMPGSVIKGMRYYQEISPGVAMDRAEIISLTELLKTPAGEFQNVMKIAESSPLEPGSTEYKYYGAGVGLLQDGKLKLVKYGI